jgi:hypothetical protein
MIETLEHIPPLYAVRRRLPSGEEVNIPAQVQHEWERLNLAAQVKGKQIALVSAVGVFLTSQERIQIATYLLLSAQEISIGKMDQTDF